jgi:mannose-6-phosphate isomerase-like protein (cupin superfamily)
MGKVIIRHSDEVEPTLFQGRESRRLISPERDKTTRVSVHKITRYAGLSREIKYPKNDEVLYVLEGEGFVIEGEKKAVIKPGSCVFIPQGVIYRIYNVVELKMLAVLSPPRYRDEWKEREDLIHLEPPYVSSSNKSE